MRSVLLLLGALAATASAQSAPATADVLVTIPLTIDGSLRDLKLLRGESFEDAAVSFVRSNGLANAQDDARTRQVIDQLSGLLKTRMQELQAEEAAAAAQRSADDDLPKVQLSIPLTIEGHSSELSKYEGESTEAAVERYLYGTGFTLDAMRELYPQLVALVNRKLEEIQPPRKQLFEFSLTIDGREAVARHFEGGRPLDEAMDTLRAIGINDGEFMDRIAPQIANEILNRMNAAAAAEREEAQRVARETELRQQQLQQEQQQEQQQQSAEPPQQELPVQQQSQTQQQGRELFSMPLTLGDRAVVLVHYDGVTTRESAIRFLTDNGISDAETVNSLLPQLLELIDNQMGEVLRQEAEEQRRLQEQQTRAQEMLLLQQQQVREQELLQQQQQEQRREPLVSLPINLGADRAATLEYFEGDNVERTAEAFLVAVGLGQDANYASNHAQLVSLIQAQLAARQEQQQQQQQQQQVQQQQPEEQRSAPMFRLPVTLSGRTFDLEYIAGQEPTSVANKFCVEKHELIRAELGIDFDGNQLRECQNVLVGWIRERVTQIQQQQQQEQPSAPAPQKTRSSADMLFALEIDIGDGKGRNLAFYRDDQPVEVATEFCVSAGIDTENVPAIVEAIQAQLAKL